jgi:hypothetical protein
MLSRPKFSKYGVVSPQTIREREQVMKLAAPWGDELLRFDRGFRADNPGDREMKPLLTEAMLAERVTPSRLAARHLDAMFAEALTGCPILVLRILGYLPEPASELLQFEQRLVEPATGVVAVEAEAEVAAGNWFEGEGEDVLDYDAGEEWPVESCF